MAGVQVRLAMLKRRQFLTLLGGAAASWPLVARAQQGERMRRIGVLMTAAADDPESLARVGAFLQRLQELGWTDGRNVQVEYRWGSGSAGRIRTYATELVALMPDVILVSGNSGMMPLQQATRTLPVVFVNTSDPVGGGFVASLARPGGNATGFASVEYGMSGKWLELLKSDFAQRDTRRGHSRSERPIREWAVGCDSGRGAVPGRGGQSD